MGQTANYGLKQWEAWERPEREAVNGTTAEIDGVLAALSSGKAQVVTGTFIGDGVSGTRYFDLGAKPAVVFLVHRQNGDEVAVILEGSSYQGAEINQDGFEVYTGGTYSQNVSGRTYCYAAIW